MNRIPVSVYLVSVCALAALSVGCENRPVATNEPVPEHGDASAAIDAPAPEHGDDLAAPEGPATALDPTPGTVVRRKFEGSEVLRFELHLDQELVEIVAYQEGCDMEVIALDPLRQPLVFVDPAGNEGRERIHLLASAPGRHLLEVKRDDCESPSVAVTLEVSAARLPTADDRTRAASDRLFAECEVWWQQRDRATPAQVAKSYLDALSGFEAIGDLTRQAEALQRLGWLHRKVLEQPQVALTYYERSRGLFAALGDVRRRSGVLNNMGRVYFDLGDIDQAVGYWTRALSLKRENGDRIGESWSLGNLGLASRYRGDFQDALTYYDQALEVLQDDGISVELGRAFNNRGRFYHSLGQNHQAQVDLGRALDIGRQVKSASLQAMALTAIGQIQLEAGDPTAALSSLEAASAQRDIADSQRGRAVTLRSLGAVYERLGRLQEAAEAQHAAQDIFEESGTPRDRARVAESLGRLVLGMGAPGKAEQYFRRAHELFHELSDAEGEVSSRVGTARALREQGNLMDALEQMNTALERVDRLRVRAATPDLRAAFLARHQKDIGFLVDLLMELHQREPSVGYHRRAFEVHERSRARALFDQIAEASNTTAGQDTSEQQAVLELELLSRQQQVLRRRSSSVGQMRAIESKLDEAVRKLRSIRGEIAAADGVVGELRQDRLLGVDEIRSEVLDADSLLLAYRLGDEKSYVWLLSAASFNGFELPTADGISALVRKAHRLLQASHLRETRGRTHQVLKQLSEILLAPFVESLEHRRLLIVADGALHYLPFAALPLPGEGEERAGSGSEWVPLVARHEVVVLPSASSIAALRRRAVGRTWTGGVAVLTGKPFGNDTDAASTASDAPDGTSIQRSGTRGSLVYASYEAAAIRKLADETQGPRAVAAEVTAASLGNPRLSSYRYLHLAAHGEIDSERPELSRLVFERENASGEREDEVLYAHEVASLELPAELVVLSACETALGQEVRGEGFVGLPQGFFRAGASSVLVSLWKVDDRATAELMKYFYTGLLRNDLSAPAALQQAQNELRAQPGWRAPYFWAGFVLLGDWREGRH
ncbi:MAG: CHAT domain-containing protein [Thermoanaerobaculia bacterium]|nr:CHAT domain-containing protein [Thermoanaerobaculia bacterium]